MKKRILLKSLVCLTLILSLLFVSTGCAIFGFFKSDGKAFSEDTYVNNDSFKFNYTDKEYESYLKNIDDTYKLLLNAGATELEFSLYSTELALQQLRITDSYHLARILYYQDTTNEENYQLFIDIDNKYNVSSNEFKKLFEPAYKSQFKSDFFGEMTDTEIEKFIKHNSPSAEKVALSNQITDIQTRFNTLTREEKLSNKFDTYYSQLIEAQNSLSVLNGFDSFNEESYTLTYGRDYTAQDTLSFAELISDNLFDAVESSVHGYKKLLTTLDNQRIDWCDDFMDTPFYSTEGKALLDGFYRTLGDEIYNAYNELMDQGYYYIAHNKNAYQGAFTSYFTTLSKPYMYFNASNPYYVSVSTFVHEFGHYLNFYFAGSTSSSTYELMETHSQAGEWLFIAYLKNIIENPNDYKYVVGDRLYSDGYTIILGSLVGAFEVNAYANDLDNGKTYDQLMITIKNNLYGQGTLEDLYVGFLKPEQYYRLVTIDQPSYYISYSVSLISSLQIYAISINDYNAAVTVYTDLLKLQSGYTESLLEVGLSSPFEQETYLLISTVFSLLNN